MPIRHLVLVVALPSVLRAQSHQPPLNVLPASGTTQSSTSPDAATPPAAHLARHVASERRWDCQRLYIEISRGDRRKWEFDMHANARAIDRVISEDIGGYPVNYGFVPQTVSYDGDPFDALVLGPSLPGGDVVRGVIVGLMYMEDEKGIDSKVVMSPVTREGRPRYQLMVKERETTAEYFRKYKRDQRLGAANWSESIVCTPRFAIAHRQSAGAHIAEQRVPTPAEQDQDVVLESAIENIGRPALSRR